MQFPCPTHLMRLFYWISKMAQTTTQTESSTGYPKRVENAMKLWFDLGRITPQAMGLENIRAHNKWNLKQMDRHDKWSRGLDVTEEDYAEVGDEMNVGNTYNINLPVQEETPPARPAPEPNKMPSKKPLPKWLLYSLLAGVLGIGGWMAYNHFKSTDPDQDPITVTDTDSQNVLEFED